MLQMIWVGMLGLSIVCGLIQGRLDAVAQAVTDSAKLGFEITLGLVGILSLWLGIMAIAKESGLLDGCARFLKPILTRLFPDVPEESPAMGSITLNIAANMLGLGNAATPFGLQAMKDLQELNPDKNVASDSMCVLLAINTSSVQLIPATAIAFLAANGSTHPGSVIFSSLIATSVSTIVAIIAVKKLAKYFSPSLQPVDNL